MGQNGPKMGPSWGKMAHPDWHSHVCVIKSQQVSKLVPKITIAKCSEYAKLYENNNLSMVFVDLGKITKIVTKCGSETGSGCDLLPSWTNLGQDGTKLGPS